MSPAADCNAGVSCWGTDFTWVAVFTADSTALHAAEGHPLWEAGAVEAAPAAPMRPGATRCPESDGQPDEALGQSSRQSSLPI